jgi:hypothetical protein
MGFGTGWVWVTEGEVGVGGKSGGAEQSGLLL